MKKQLAKNSPSKQQVGHNASLSIGTPTDAPADTVQQKLE